MRFIDELYLIYTIVIRNLKQFEYINFFFYLFGNFDFVNIIFIWISTVFTTYFINSLLQDREALVNFNF